MNIPQRTIERLSKYRRLLKKYVSLEEPHIYSHNLARMLSITPAQVRRDLMLIGLSGNHRRGYNIKELIKTIGDTIDNSHGERIAIVGAGNLGSAIIRYIKKNEETMKIVAAFDTDPNKTNTTIHDVPCYDFTRFTRLIPQENIRMGILAVPPENAQEVAKIMVDSGIKGILNFSAIHLDLPQDVYVKDYDIMTSLEEIGYFVNR